MASDGDASSIGTGTTRGVTGAGSAAGADALDSITMAAGTIGAGADGSLICCRLMMSCT
jgi:hypothetical protein